MATLEEAVENVQRLENLALSDEQPNIEPPPVVLTYRANFDTDFEDKEAFITGVSRYMEEASIHQKLVSVLAGVYSQICTDFKSILHGIF